jgi:hypothetical protein
MVCSQLHILIIDDIKMQHNMRHYSMQQAPYASYKVKYMGKPKYVLPVVVEQCMIENHICFKVDNHI